jgi:hypothetical protein
MHQTRMVFTLLQDLGDDRFLADVALGDMPFQVKKLLDLAPHFCRDLRTA